MDENVLRAVGEELEKWFPDEWEQGDIERYLGGTKFTRDIKALNQTINTPIRDFVSRGGKRMRPALFLSLLQGFDVSDFLQYVDIALVIELAHNGTLVIDDIEDDSELRRGKPTLHKAYGLDVAVNTGVTMHLLPLVVLSKEHENLSDSQRVRLLQVYSEELTNVYFGQATDITWHNQATKEISEDMYMEMCRLKTGSLMRMAARFACVIAELGVEKEQLFKHFAESAGIAFQIKDDILDLTATEEEFGKAFGNDISEGKMSLPVLYALSALQEKEKSRLLEILHAHTHEKELIKEARSLILSTEAISEAETTAQAMFHDAWDAVKEHIANEEGKKNIEALTEKFVKRDH